MRDFYTKENMQGELFHVREAGLLFEPAELSFETDAETSREGTIRVRRTDGQPARGYVYPSERCMRGVREQFAPAADGTGSIRWKFDSRGIAPGRTVRGFFRVISPCGEYRIPYEVRVSGKGEPARRKGLQTRTSERGPRQNVDFSITVEKEETDPGIRTKEDFLGLAGRDFMAAADFFYSSRFIKILTEDEDRTLYRGLSMQKDNLHNVGEFLIAACGMERTVYEPVEKTLTLQTQAGSGRTDSRMAGSRAERALEAHRQRVRRNGIGAGAGRQAGPAAEDLIYLPLRIRRTGVDYTGVTILAEGRFLPSAPFAVLPADIEKNAVPASDMGKNAVPAADLGKNAASAADMDKNAVSAAGVENNAAPAGDMEKNARPAEEPGEDLLFTVRIPVNRAALHAGRNVGRVIVRGPFNDAVLPVEVCCAPSDPPLRRRQERELRLLELQLMRLYVDFRLTDSRAHADLEQQADHLIDEIIARSHRDQVPRLYRVHMRILRGQYAEAEKELNRIAVRYGGQEAVRNYSARFTGEQEGAYCYRQYLYARCRVEDTQLRSRVVRFLRGVYRTSGSWQAAWMLMDLSEEYAPGTAARWNFLRHQYESGCSSPVIFIEGWEMVREDPRILLPGSSVQERWARDDFGLLVLWYAARNNVLSPKAAEVMISLAEKKKSFSPLLFKGLCASIEVEGLQDRRRDLLRAVCIQLIRAQDISPRAHTWYVRALEESVSLTNLEEYRLRSAPVDDSFYRLPAGCNAILRTTASRAQRAVLCYDRFHREQVFPIRDGAAPMSVHGNANVIFLEDGAGNRYTSSLPYTLDLQEDGPDAGGPGSGGAGEDLHALAVRIGFGDRDTDLADFTPETAAAAGRLLDSGALRPEARTDLLLRCLEACDRAGEAPEVGEDYEAASARYFLSRVDPSACEAPERARFLRFLEKAGEYETAAQWLAACGTEGVDAELLGRLCLGLSWEAGYETVLVPAAWEAFSKGNTDSRLLTGLAASFQGLSDELCLLRKACADGGLSTGDLDGRLVRQMLYSGAVSAGHAGVIVSSGEKLGEAFLPAVARYADYAFSEGISMGIRMTDLVVRLIAEGRDQAADICRIACLKELSMRQGDYSDRERTAISASLSVLLSKGIIFPFYRQFPGFDDRLDLYAEETLMQYHPSSHEEAGGRHIVFHYATSRRGEAGSYRSRPMKEMYRDFYVSGFLLFYGEQMHYYITDDQAEKHVVQSGMIGQDARIPENCSGRFGLINETTRAAALRDYDEALSLLTAYYRRSYLQNELFRR